MEKEKLGAGIQYDHSIKADKHFFGGFLNLAENNITTVFNAFNDRYRKVSSEKDKYAKKTASVLIEEYFSDIVSDAEYKNRIDFLKIYFPVIHYIENKNNTRNHFRLRFVQLIKTINDLRNFYTHYYHKPLEIEADFFNFLDDVFLTTIQEVKKHKMKDDKTRHLLNKNLSENLNQLYKSKKQKLEQMKNEGKKVNLDEIAVKNSVLNDSFFHLLYKKDQVTQIYRSQFNGTAENNITLSQSGLIFLLGMFLTKKESEDLRSRVSGFKAKFIKSDDLANNIKFMATHWVFSYLAYRGHKHRLASHFQQEGLLIQIIDELSKVPDEVYVTLDKEKQNSFIEDINEYIKNGKEDLSLEESKVVHPVIRKRYENKFNYFALRYLDEFADFPTIRFQIHLGNYIHDRRIKDINGTAFQTERVVKEKINVFSRLSEVTNLKSSYVLNKKNPVDIDGWEIFPKPSYNFAANNIPIFINLQTSKVEGARKLHGQLIKNRIKHYENNGKEEKQNLTRQNGKLNKEQITQLIDPNIQDGKFKNTYVGPPLAMLSLNELPAMLYELLVKEVPAKELEDRMVAKLVTRFKTIENYNPSQNLPLSQITKKLRKSSDQEQIDTAKILRAANREIEITEQKLALISQNRKDTKNNSHKRKYIFTTRELGIEAGWLAYDIKRFMPKEKRELLKGYQFAQIQHSLSKFDQNPNELINIISSVWNFREDSYVFSQWLGTALIKAKRFDSAYEIWLKKRKEYFEIVAENLSTYESKSNLLKKFIQQHHIFEIFKESLYKIESRQKQIHRLLKTALVFPRGIFDDKPTFIQGVNINLTPNLYAEWYQYTYKSSHQFQKFYDIERDYNDWYDCEKLKDNEVLKNKNQLSPEEQFAKLRLKQDIKIKQIKIQDLFLKLIAQNIYNKIFNTNISLELKDLYLAQEERIEKENKALIQNNRKTGDSSQNIINDNFIWSMTIPFDQGQIKEPAVKLKDLGKFKNFIADFKVQKLLQYDTARIWTKQMLDDELFIKSNSYETIRREQIFKILQDFEKDILTLNNFDGTNHPSDFEKVDMKGNRNPNFKFYVAKGILEKYNLASEQEISWLLQLEEDNIEETSLKTIKEKCKFVQYCFFIILIRNKFAHNQFIEANYMQYLMSKTSINPECSYSEYIREYLRDATSKILYHLNSKHVH